MMQEMLEAFGAREKYEALLTLPTGTQEEFSTYMKANYRYKRDLLEFATQWDKDHPQENDFYYTCRDTLRSLSGRQSATSTYRCLQGHVSFERIQEEVRQETDRLCYPYDIVVCG